MSSQALPIIHRPPAKRHRLKVLLACSGLDHTKRGFESFSRGCFQALRDEDQIEIQLIKGSGPTADRERSVRTMTRDSALARALGRVARREPFRFEQVAFALSLQPVLMSRRPDVVYFSEWHTGLVLALLRHVTSARYRLVLFNGGMAVEGFQHLDRVQELTPASLRIVLERGATPSRHVLLPPGVSIESRLHPLTELDRAALRRRLGLPEDRPILLSVAALNRYHKRIDYLIEEVARLPEPRPFLLLDGQPEADAPDLRALAACHLGASGHSFRTMPSSEISDLYRASDALVLSSLGESFGLVLAEAMSHGLTCFAHDYEVTRFVLGDHGRFGDFSKPGGLAELIGDQHAYRHDPDAEQRRHRFVYDSFSWDRLRPRYVEMLSTAANNTVSSSSAEKLSSQKR